MKVTIRLRFHTRFGQTLFLCGEHPLLGGGDESRALGLSYSSPEFWELTLDLPEPGPAEPPVRYYYILREPDGSAVEDFGGDRRLDLASLGSGHALIVDSWNDMGAVENVFFTDPFKRVLLRNAPETPTVELEASGSHSFQVKAPLLPVGQTVCLVGSASAMGAWNQDAPVFMWRDAENGCFRVSLNLAAETFPVAYKYGIYDQIRHAFVRYEEGSNRMVTDAAAPGGQVLINDGFARWPGAQWRGAGVAIPVFSLRSDTGFGVGEFADLPLLADWARRVGLKLIQILPINDTTSTYAWTDSYPYSAISAFALHPLYLNLEQLAGAEHRSLLRGLARQRKELNAMPALDYEAVIKAKLAFARKVFPWRREQDFATEDYREFLAQNGHWLTPYTAFCFLRDKFGMADFNQWPDHRVYDADAIRALVENDATARDEMAFHRFLQFHLHLQLREAAREVRARGLILKGDIAIGVSARGVDVWQQPDLYNTDMQAGAPPDAFAAKGQNWSFPTYNWLRMKLDGYDWWKRRLAQMACYFDAFRIDHILGFFRIWSIPRHAIEGILGYFVPAIPVGVEEFAERGIEFNFERFTQPFITDEVLVEILGEKAERAKCEFLDANGHGGYSLKPAFTTQWNVAQYFASLEESRRDAKLKEGLFDLISNVLLIEAPGRSGRAFHFRLGMEQTPSFRQLDRVTQGRLKDLYLDYFFKRQDRAWLRGAMQKLPALKRVTNMLICGEDLGMVPACVPDAMKQLGLLGLEIQRMPKALNVEFSRPADAPYLSVVTPATHDMSTIRGWWMEDRELTQKFFAQELRRIGPAPVDCQPWVNREIVQQHLDSPAMWSIFQLQDLLGMDAYLRRPDTDAERINVPAIPNYYWRYRMHINLEALARAEQFNSALATMVHHSGR